jgi:hypothetical protein
MKRPIIRLPGKRRVTGLDSVSQDMAIATAFPEIAGVTAEGEAKSAKSPPSAVEPTASQGNIPLIASLPSGRQRRGAAVIAGSRK